MSETYTAAGDFRLHDIARDPHPTPCPDCGRTYLNGENVTWTVPTLPTGVRVAWSGCVDCWLRRTNPTTPPAPESATDPSACVEGEA